MVRTHVFASITVDCSGLGFADRQTALQEIVEELRVICDDAPGGAFAHPALDVLPRTISSSSISIARADNHCWERIIRELVQLRATMRRLRADAASTAH
ncbi:hypothetical protein [Rhizobium etli]|uniref:Uncharacterized protein n=1 Tax=Rhizobium etli TaxID=29449 RepID=A0A7W6VBT7_RHIET|nr:hypothetical protein [Rhizobium etli]MBB4481368.1 hypothetical protein [Rhizobium etli]MBB4537019.1 hypothetical protein [Rhizobium etli]